MEILWFLLLEQLLMQCFLCFPTGQTLENDLKFSQKNELGIKQNCSDPTENEINTSNQLPVVWNATKNASNTKALQNSYNKSRDVEEIDVRNNGTIKTQKQEDDDDEFDDSDDGGGQNFVTMLISTFIGTLSTPEGGVDVDALVALIGTLSAMRDDGTYDFSGLQNTLMNFLGGGGSDVGAFVGGLLGAVIKGVANPPGAKGAGKLTGSIVGQLLPALSAPAPNGDNGNPPKPSPKPQLDIFGFLKGFLAKFSSTSSGSGPSKITPAPFLSGKTIQGIFKFFLAAVTSSLFTYWDLRGSY